MADVRVSNDALVCGFGVEKGKKGWVSMRKASGSRRCGSSRCSVDADWGCDSAVNVFSQDLHRVSEKTVEKLGCAYSN